MKIALEYGDSKTYAELPEDAMVVKFGKTYQSFPAPDPIQTIKKALENPLGSERISEKVKPGDKVVIAFPDRVKGGPNFRRLAIPLILEELKKAGVSIKDVTLLGINGLHRKNTIEEVAEYLGWNLVNEFYPARLIFHDADDPNSIVYIGESKLGDPVYTNKLIVEADLTILLGHALPNHYGGFSGGYKGLVTGTGTWKSIAAHHHPRTILNPDMLPVSPFSTMRKQFEAQGKAIEEYIGKDIFAVDAVLNPNMEIIGVFAGKIDEVQKESWKLSAKQYIVSVPEKADVVVVGLPRTFHYGPGMGTNPILILNALGGLTARCYPVIKDKDTIVIAFSVCDGWFNDEWFPSYREIYKLYQYCCWPHELTRYHERVVHNQEYIYKYRYCYGYEAFHGFSMMYFGEVALRHTLKIFLVGAREPGYARGIGLIPVKKFEDALEEVKKILGKDPRILALPEYFLRVPLLLKLPTFRYPVE